MVASLVTSSRSRRRRSVTSRSSTSAPIRSPSGRSGMLRRMRLTWSVPTSVSRSACPESTALSVSSSGRRRGGTSSRVRSARTWCGQVAGEPEAAVDRQRVGARVDDPARVVEPDEAVAHARRVGVVAALALVAGTSRRRSSGSARPPSAGRTAPGGSASGRPAGWCCGPPGRSRRPARRTGMTSTRTGTSSRHSGSPSRTSRPVACASSSIRRRPDGMKVPTTSSVRAVGPVVGRIWPPAQKPRPSRSGSHSTRSAKDRSAMICQSAIRR